MAATKAFNSTAWTRSASWRARAGAPLRTLGASACCNPQQHRARAPSAALAIAAERVKHTVLAGAGAGTLGRQQSSGCSELRVRRAPRSLSTCLPPTLAARALTPHALAQVAAVYRRLPLPQQHVARRHDRPLRVRHKLAAIHGLLRPPRIQQGAAVRCAAPRAAAAAAPLRPLCGCSAAPPGRVPLLRVWSCCVGVWPQCPRPRGTDVGCRPSLCVC